MRAKKTTLQSLLGDVVAERRAALRLNQDEFGEKCGLHRTFISRVERGVQSVGLDSLAKLATGLSISMTELVAAIERAQRDQEIIQRALAKR